MATRWYFNSNFIKNHKFNFKSLCILQDIYSWILGTNPPEQICVNNKRYFYLSQTYFANINEGLIDQSGMSNLYLFYKKVGIVNHTQTIKKKFFVSFNWDIVEESLVEKLEFIPDNSWFDRIHEYIRQEKERESYNNDKGDEMLFDVEDRKGYSLEAEMLIKKLIKKNRTLFTTQLPEDRKDGKKTGVFIHACKVVQDIYNGNFINSRIYPLSEKFLNNRQFNIQGWREKIEEVKGNWNSVQKLLLNAIKNLYLMYEQNRMPFDKAYIQTSIGSWLYDTYTTKGEPQSQFILCLFEPPLTSKQLSENKADRIFDTFTIEGKKNANKLYDLCPDGTPAGTFFENVKKMIEWGKIVLRNDLNAKYWFTHSSELPSLFADFCRLNNISVNNSTVDIEKAVNCNGPWVWFVTEASKKHQLNPRLCDCVEPEDFLDCYKVKSISFEDMSEVVF